jgi:hypothetical protein
MTKGLRLSYIEELLVVLDICGVVHTVAVVVDYPVIVLKEGAHVQSVLEESDCCS